MSIYILNILTDISFIATIDKRWFSKLSDISSHLMINFCLEHTLNNAKLFTLNHHLIIFCKKLFAIVFILCKKTLIFVFFLTVPLSKLASENELANSIEDGEEEEEDEEDDSLVFEDDFTTHGLGRLSSAATCLVAGIEYTHGQQVIFTTSKHYKL